MAGDFMIVPQEYPLPARHRVRQVVTEKNLLAYLFGGNAVGSGFHTAFNLESPKSPDSGVHVFDGRLDESAARENGRAILVAAQRAVSADNARGLGLLWSLFFDLVSRAPCVHERLDAWWTRGAKEQVLRIAGHQAGRGRMPASVTIRRAAVLTVDGLCERGMSAKRAASQVGGLRLDGLPSGRSIENLYSAQRDLFLRSARPYWVDAHELCATPWIPPEQRDRIWLVLEPIE